MLYIESFSKFKRNEKPRIIVSWDCENGIEYPIEHKTTAMGKEVKYRGKEVVMMNDEYFQLVTNYDHIDASGKDSAILAPLTKI